MRLWIKILIIILVIDFVGLLYQAYGGPLSLTHQYMLELKSKYDDTVGVCREYWHNDYYGCKFIELDTCYNSQYQGDFNYVIDYIYAGMFNKNRPDFVSEGYVKVEFEPPFINYGTDRLPNNAMNYCARCLAIDSFSIDTVKIDDEARIHYCPKWIEDVSFIKISLRYALMILKNPAYYRWPVLYIPMH